MKFTLEIDGVAYEVAIDRKARTVTVDGERFPLDGKAVRLLQDGCADVAGREVVYSVRDLQVAGITGATARGPSKVKPPMTGKLESIKVSVGQAVAKGDVLFVLEAMKMHNEVRSPAAGKVTAIHLNAGTTLETNQVVLEIQPI